ncbi:MAG: GNAT family N-acetyltransferase [Lachnospiraceae bacterium]|nr:GNAT family N-acetyltransferase [Lachnospiraceae bacterium]
MEIRRFKQEDAEETAQVIAETLRRSNGKDYPQQYIEKNISSHSADVLMKLAKERHMYVVCDKERIVGTGGIAGFWGSITESILLTIFVLPEYQGKGIGRQIQGRKC